MPLDYSKNEEYELLEEGWYEVYIDNAEIKTFDSGASCINLTHKVRDDVEQNSQGRLVFESVWGDKKHPGEFQRHVVSNILKTQGTDGQYNFEDNEELVQYLNGLYMKIFVEKNDADEYNEEPYNRVKFLKGHEPSAFPPKKLGNTTSTSSTTVKKPSTTPIVSDEDLPF